MRKQRGRDPRLQRDRACWRVPCSGFAEAAGDFAAATFLGVGIVVEWPTANGTVALEADVIAAAGELLASYGFDAKIGTGYDPGTMGGGLGVESVPGEGPDPIGIETGDVSDGDFVVLVRLKNTWLGKTGDRAEVAWVVDVARD